jgi:DNA recombination protein RmuC
MKTEIIFLLSGLVIGGALTWLVSFLFYSKKTAVIESGKRSLDAVNAELRNQIDELRRETSNLQNELNNESQLRAAVEARFHEAEKNFQAMEKKMLDQFSSLSLEALSKNSAEFLKLAEEHLKSQTVEGTKELENKKKLIEKSLQDMDRTLAEVRQKIEDVSRGNVKVTALMENHEKVTSRLRETTEHLRQALASSKKRGEWGERMAEDIIRLVGMVEGVNYIKQKTIEGSARRPDYTFFMPNKLKINMDVKFPLDNYIHYLDAHNENERRRYRDELIKNARAMIKQVTTRDYINPADNTVDYVLVFIPNEQVYGFIHESDTGIMDEALRQKVILCSPFTLYAVLAVIRQAVENFNLEKTASEMLRLLGEFSKQWKNYKEKFKSMGDKIEAARKEYDALVTTRTNMLERPLRKIDDLRKQRDIIIEPGDKGAPPLIE